MTGIPTARKIAPRPRGRPGSCLVSSTAIVLVLLVSHCGYKSTPSHLPTVQSIAVMPFQSRTTTFQVEQYLDRALVRELVESTGYKVVNEPVEADALFEGTIKRADSSPVTFANSSFGSAFLVTLTASLRLVDRTSGKVLFQDDNYIFRNQYVINPDTPNFFSELNPALERIARDFAASVVATLKEDF